MKSKAIINTFDHLPVSCLVILCWEFRDVRVQVQGDFWGECKAFY